MLLSDPDLRPRERLFTTGSGEISDAELVAVVLGTGRPGIDAIGLARELLESAGGLPGLARMLPHELARHRGIGSARAARLCAAFALGRRVLVNDRAPGAVLATAADVHRHVWPRLAGVDQEVFLAIAVDSRHSAITEIEIARGTVAGVHVHPREVFRPLIRLGASSVIVVHNHPSGDLSPSPDDIALTERLHTVGSLVGIPLLDHVIVTAGGAMSLEAWVKERIPT